MYIAIREEQQEKSKRRRSQAQDTINENDPEMAMMDELTVDDWDNSMIIHEVLEPIKYWTQHLDGNSTANN